jgi:putative ABC transport system permease protein
MITKLFKFSVKYFRRRRAHVLINIFGLSTGIACSLLIALFIAYEVSYDRFNAKSERIYDLVMNFKISDQEFTDAMSSTPVGPAMREELPEVEDFLRIMKYYGVNWITYNHENFYDDNILLADSTFFNFFSVPVLSGDPSTLLNAPGKVVLTASVAKRIFGDQDPVGKILKFGKDTATFTVSGVMADLPGNSHFKAGVIASFLSHPESKSPMWASNSLNTYVMLRPNANPDIVNDKLHEMTVSHVGPELQRFLNLSFDEFIAKGNKYGYYLQKLTDIHLDTSVKPYFTATGDPKLLKILAGIALLILVIASINFTNLSTAQAAGRAKEVGIKKLSGSSGGMLVTQFLTESILMAFMSTIIALAIIKIVLPFFNRLLETSLSLDLFTTLYLVPFLVLFAVFTGLLAGSYPAFFLSSFNPFSVLKGGSVKQKGILKKVLVVMQFTISIFLIVGTIIMYRQILYMLNRDNGFVKDQLFVLENQQALGTRVQAFKNVLKSIPGVINVTSSTSVPGSMNNNNGYMLEGKKDETILMWTDWVDYDFIETYGMKLASGRFFSKDFTSDDRACLVNESAIKKYNIDPHKLRIMGYRDSGKVTYYPIIGVVKDFVFETQRNQVAPFIFRLRSDGTNRGYLTAKISANNYRETIQNIGDRWKEFVPDEPFKYFFVDDAMNKLYSKERQNATIAIIASVLAIIIAALGLLGLTSYTVAQRTREIGIRKAMGSSVAGIYFVISKEIFGLILVSAIFSFPVIYLVAHKWLENFYYRISPGAISFLAGVVVALGVALVTVSYHVLKAARVSPAQSLKYE